MKEFHIPAGLIALALGGFGIGSTEFVIMGLLPGAALLVMIAAKAAAKRQVAGAPAAMADVERDPHEATIA